ncbi:hypothetical protein [Shimia marina]|uniref:Stress response protein n=1 Tax=Shimia marina TaxID=321267 RepID=A0A0P1FF69_9RHOB|nr:hypothetical protein [Shimia marina]CUH53302.1 hypothetical protein SHM7688_02755 [Shimia marina]SFD80343.1 hypothetical protein SAMN04488037_102516 [Shimia marina]
MLRTDFPENVIQGDHARLFPVLATTSKEGRTTAIVLSCLSLVREFASTLLSGVGQRLGTRAKINTYTEVVFKSQAGKSADRPDGLIVVRVGSREWKALVEAKVGNSDLNADQIERYRTLAKENGVDCVITISNQFATAPDAHPLEDVRKSRSKIPVYHWSWMHILTTADLLLNTGGIGDDDQHYLLNELHRFLSHESAGVKGFDKMPKAWTELNRLVSSGGVIPAKSQEAKEVIYAWHQETRDLTLILSRKTETVVVEKLSRKHAADPALRQKDEFAELKERNRLSLSLGVPDAAANVDIVADLMRRTIEVGMTLRAPDDKRTTKARLNWLLRQIKTEDLNDLYVRLLWPGASEPTQHLLSDLLENIEICEEGKQHLVSHGFHVFYSKRLGGRFTQQSNFIVDLEAIVPHFYGEVGADLKAWQRPAPRIKHIEGQGEDQVDSITD